MPRELITDDPDHEKDIELRLKQVIDPELMVDVWNLGLIYKVTVKKKKAVVEMTLTSPNCPTSEQLFHWVWHVLTKADYIDECKVELVWDPIWDATQMTEIAQLQTGFML